MTDKRACFNCGREVGLLADLTGVCPHCGALLPTTDFETLPEQFAQAFRRLEYDTPALTNTAAELEALFS